MNIFKSPLIVLLCIGSNVLNAQINLNNPSLEGTKGQAQTPTGWTSEASVDIEPRTWYPNITASDGATFVHMYGVSNRDIDGVAMGEGIKQDLPCPLLTGETYQISLDLNQGGRKWAGSVAMVLGGAGFLGAVVEDVIWQSPLTNGEETGVNRWQRFTIEFIPAIDYTSIAFFSCETPNFDHANASYPDTRALIDNISEITMSYPANNLVVTQATCNQSGSASFAELLNGDYNYQWFEVGNLTAIQTGSSTNIVGLSAGEYYLRITDNVNACYPDRVLYFSITAPVLEMDVSNQTAAALCSGDSIELFAELLPTTFFNLTDVRVDDDSTQTSTIEVPNNHMPLLNVHTNIRSVCVDVEHDNLQDLDLRLTSPQGTIVNLSLGNGTNGSNYDSACFVVSGAPAILGLDSASTPFDSNYLPEQPFSMLDGEQAYGTWQLEVADRGAFRKGGVLKGWSIQLSNNAHQIQWSTNENAIAGADSVYLKTDVPNSSYYVADAEDIFGCFHSDSVQVNLTASKTAGADSTYVTCQTGNSIRLITLLSGADAGGTWLFTSGGGALSGSGDATFFNPLLANESDGLVAYSYIVSNTGSCPNDTATAYVQMYNAANSGTDSIAELCYANDALWLFTYVGNNAQSTGFWEPINTTIPIFQNADTAYIIPPKTTNSETYQFRYVTTATAPCENDTAYVAITVHPVIDSITENTIPTGCLANTGKLEITGVNGGTSPYEYSFNAGAFQASNFVDNQGAGEINITVRDINGCSLDSVFTIQTANGPTDFEATATDRTCASTNGEIVIGAVTGGAPSYTYSINYGSYQAGNTFSNLDSGYYHVAVKDANGCSFVKQIFVGTATGVNGFSATLIKETCNQKNGSIEVNNVLGGTPSFTYSLNGGTAQPDSLFTNLEAGNYTVTLQDAEGCKKDSVIVLSGTQGPAVAVVSQSNPTCFGESTGSAEALANGGNGTIVYEWFDAANASISSTPTITGKPAGTYLLVASDANSCADSLEITLMQPSKIMLSLATTTASCGQADGTATVSVAGGAGGYLYAWNTTPVQNTATASGLSSGTPYRVVVTDANSCAVDTAVNISSLNGPHITFVSESRITCSDSANGKITTSVTGGALPYSMSWNTNPTQTDTVASSLPAGTFTFTVTDDAGCSASYSHTLLAPDTIKSQLTITDDACGQSTGSVVASTTGGTGTLNYQWNDPTNQTTATASNLLANTYQLLVTDANDCEANFIATVNDIPAPVITSITTQNAHCEGGNDGSITAVVTGAGVLTYQWVDTTSNQVQTGNPVSDLVAGVYRLTVSDNQGCSVDSLITIGFDNPRPVFVLEADTAFCQNDSVLIGLQSPVADSYLWNTGAATRTIYAKTAGEYRLMVTENGCSYQDTIQVRMDVVPDLNLGQDSVFCGSVLITLDITVTGNTDYEWKNGSTSPTQTITLPGEYWAIISRNTCIVSDTVAYFTQPETELILPEDQVLCTGESYEIVPTIINGINPQYQWKSGATTSNLTVNQTGTYILEVTDAKCISSDTILVTFNTQPVVDLGSDIESCEGEKVVLYAGSSNSTYIKQWNTGETSQSIEVTTNGTYSVTVTNLNCEATNEVEVKFNPIPVFSLAADTSICLLDEIQIGIQRPNTDAYLWDSGETTPYINSQGGTHILTITENGCSYSDSIAVLTNPLPEIPNLDTKKCRYDTITIDATCLDCISYLWGNGDTIPSQFIERAAVRKDITVTNSYGCSSSKVVIVTENRAPYCLPQFYVPNSFTPDGDGLNEVFLPVFRYELLDTYSLGIYNRWGGLVFNSNNPKMGWDGVFREQMSQTGIYTWVINYRLVGEAEIVQLFGKVSLIK